MNLPVRLVAFTIGLILASSGIGVGQEKYSPDDEFVKAIATKAIKYLEEQNKATSPEPQDPGELVLAALTVVEYQKRYDQTVDETHPITVRALKSIQNRVKDLKETEAGTVPRIYGRGIYEAALSVILLIEVNQDLYKREISDLLKFIYSQQQSNGAYGYAGAREQDTSQSQYVGLLMAVLKVHEHDLEPDRAARMLGWYCDAQIKEGEREGGWVYHYNDLQPSPSHPEVRLPIQLASLSSVYLLADFLNLAPTGAQGNEKIIAGIDRPLPPSVEEYNPNKEARNKSAPMSGFDRGKLGRVQRLGNQWVEKHFALQPPDKNWTFYYLYAFERYAFFREKNAGMMREFGNWYDNGVEFLKEIQQANGGWRPAGNDATENMNNSTCLAVLFLVRSSQILLKDPRDSTLVDNYGVFDSDKPLVEGKDGKIEVAKDELDSSQMIDMLKEGASEDQMRVMIEQLSIFIKEMNDKEGGNDEMIAFLRGLVTHEDAYRRLAAVKVLSGLQNLDNVPALLYAMGDEEMEIAIEAHKGLRLVSRKLNYITLPSEPTKLNLQDAKAKWTKWYLGIRPNAEMMD